MRTAVIVVCFICPNCLSLRDNAACCIPLRDLRNLRENNTQEYSIYIAQMKTQKSPADLADYADETQKQQKQQQPSPICLSLRNNAACCIPLCVICAICGRIFTEEYSIYITQMNPKYSPADLADLRRRNPKQQNNNNSLNLKQPVFLCDIMQPAAFVCVICVICGRITRKKTQSISTNETPKCLPQIPQIYADEPQNNNIPKPN